MIELNGASGRRGEEEIWRHGDMEIRGHGDKGTWRQGDMETSEICS